MARRYGVAKVCREAAEMIAREKLDAIVASQPFRRHGIVVTELLKARRPIFREATRRGPRGGADDRRRGEIEQNIHDGRLPQEERPGHRITCTIELSPCCTTVDWQEQALVCFERGWIKLDLPAPLATNRPGKVEVYSDPGEGRTPTLTAPTLPWVHAMRQQAENFIAAVAGERPLMTAAEEALEDLRVARVYICLLTGK